MMRSRMTVLLLSALLALSCGLWEASLPVQAAAQPSGVTTPQERQQALDHGVTVESSSFTTAELAAETRQLDAGQARRLRVTWNKPRRTVDNRFGRFPRLEISGKLCLLQDDGKTLKPVDWPLPIRVVLCRRPKLKPDWSRWHNRRDSLWSDNLVGRELIVGARSTPGGGSEPIPLPKKPAGAFTALFDLSEIETAVGETQPFQVGLCLGTRKGKTVTWCNVVPILPRSVQMMEVAGPKPISYTLQLINACPTPMGWGFDPIDLVRAANHLRSLGKDKAIAELREYLDLAYDTGFRRNRIDPANIDTSNQSCLACLVPLVYAGVRQEPRIRVWQGIPFHTVVITGTSGWPEPTGPLVDEAARSGKLIQDPLRPVDNPLEAADALLKKMAAPVDHAPGLPQRGLREHLRQQAWGAIRHLVDPDGKLSPELSTEAGWHKVKARAARLQIHWDEKRQEYVATKKPR